MDEKKSSVTEAVAKDATGALSTLAKGTVDGAAALLSKICLPAAEEYGLLLRDKVRNYRGKNLLKITKEAETILAQYTDRPMHAHPRLVAEIMDHGSWADDDAIQKKWAGLLISSCDEAGNDDSNLMFIDLLRQLSSAEVRILDYVCQKANKIVIDVDVLSCNQLVVSGERLTMVSEVNDMHRLQRELAHLRTLGLLVDGEMHERFHGDLEKDRPGPSEKTTAKNTVRFTEALVSPSDLAFHLYVRSRGFTGTPVDYFFGQDYLTRDRYEHSASP